MAEKKYVYEAEVMTLPPLYLVVGEEPVSDSNSQFKSGFERLKLDPRMEGVVKRLIAYLKDEK
jgi:hypothetical protein